jgi:hypothetical protein
VDRPDLCHVQTANRRRPVQCSTRRFDGSWLQDSLLTLCFLSVVGLGRATDFLSDLDLDAGNAGNVRVASLVLLKFGRATPAFLRDEARRQLLILRPEHHHSVEAFLGFLDQIRENGVVRTSVLRVIQENMLAVHAAETAALADAHAEFEADIDAAVVDVVEGAAGDDDSTGSRQSSTGSGRAMEQGEFLGTTGFGGAWKR